MKWSQLNKKSRVAVDGGHAPDPNEEYFLYQTLVGTWPLRPRAGRNTVISSGGSRQYMLKALREAKVNTSWINPRIAYERAFEGFVKTILDRRRGRTSFSMTSRSFTRRSPIAACATPCPRPSSRSRRPASPIFTRARSYGISAWWTPTTGGPWTTKRRKRHAARPEAGGRGGPLTEIARAARRQVGGRKDQDVRHLKALNFRKGARPTCWAGRAMCPLRGGGREGRQRLRLCAPRAGRRLYRGGPAAPHGPSRRGARSASRLREGVWDGSFLPVPSLRVPRLRKHFYRRDGEKSTSRGRSL